MAEASNASPAGEQPKSPVALREEEILARWQERRIFERTLEQPAPRGEVVFYDGPPFATGLPHFGHVLPSSIKDAIPRYLTMRGHRVPRVWGWDCHGVPIENLVQKELGLKTKADVEAAGLAAFATAARDSVLRYDAEWKRVVPRLGRWVDMERAYRTMDPGYTESVWWAWSELDRKGLAYEGFKSVHVSPALETPLSNFEVAQAYKDIDDLSVTVALPLASQPGVSLLAWTTTPWTLPGNVAAAVGAELDYAYVEAAGKDGANQTYVVAAGLVETVFEGKPHAVKKTVKGAALVGERYEPPFPESTAYPADRAKLWRVFAGDFVTAEDGTGVVHIATGFGEDDLQLGQREGLPVVQHVGIDGVIRAGIPELDGRQAKPGHDPAETDVEVVKLLAARGRLFAKKKYSHSYPHCWRTGVPLLNYALSSWFVKVSAVRGKLAKLNGGVKWVPESVGQNRFGNWLAEAKDWSVSRARFWGTPLPIWRDARGRAIVVGSLAELRRRSRSTNEFHVMRHGEAESNARGFISDSDAVPSHLTEAGRAQAAVTAAALRSAGITKIYCSPLLRTRETAEIVRETLGLSSDAVVVDPRLREVMTGVFAGKPLAEYRAFFAAEPNPRRAYFEKKPEGGENLRDVRRRVGEFLYEVDAANRGEKILVVSHEYSVWMLEAVARGADDATAMALKTADDFVATGETRPLDFAPLPHDADYVLDFHRPYIDEVVLREGGEALRRVPDVFDTWFDSGSVPFASQGYPMSTERCDPAPGGFWGRLLGRKGKGFPAAFVAEGVDQTRGWFYTLMVLSGALFGRAPYERVVVNGTILAEDGRKMSKSLKNYPPVESIVDRYGADALRLSLLGSPVVRGEEARFSERGVDEVSKKVVQRLGNVLAFYEQGVGGGVAPAPAFASASPLDRWVASRTAALAAEVTAGMEAYELDRAVRPFLAYADDLSNWYVRRSRDRMRESAPADDRAAALGTLRAALLELAKLLAPFAPFLAEHLYLGAGGPLDSVHLERWPAAGAVDEPLLAAMAATRAAASAGLEARAKSGLKARQPLQSLVVKDGALFAVPGLAEIVRDEVNVKEVRHDPALQEAVDLDTALSLALRHEGLAREVMRLAQDTRKVLGLAPSDVVSLTVDADRVTREALEPFRAEIAAKANARELRWNSVRVGGEILEHDGYRLELGVSLE